MPHIASMYKDDPLWSDITPVDIRSEEPIFKVNYSNKFADVFGYYLAIKATNEVSKRVFDILTDALKLNSSNYSLWTHRRKLLDDLNLDLEEEIAFLDNIIYEDPKVYQAWHHRELIVPKCSNYETEYLFLKNVLNLDNKNYHAWQYRVWVLDHFDKWNHPKELDNIKFFTDIDPYNNSVWNFRFTLSNKIQKYNNIDLVEKDLQEIFCYCSTFHDNESAFNYLQGLCKFLDAELFKKTLCFSSELVESILDSDNGDDNFTNSKKYRIAFSFHVHFLIDNSRLLKEYLGDEYNKFGDKVSEYVELLSSKIDIIRRSYWQFYESFNRL